MRYLLRHREELTLFQRKPGVPLDNNICEQALKMAIRHWKNSLFYKTQRGADVGDVYMTLIHSCYFSSADPFDYLTELPRHEQLVKADPARWLLWNYREQLATPYNEPHPTAPTADCCPTRAGGHQRRDLYDSLHGRHPLL